MIFSDTQKEIVETLFVPRMGTEAMAPLLHFLVRFTRARNVLEGGSGYTTPFIAQALSQNKEDFEAETAALRQKSERYIGEIASIVVSDPASRPAARSAGFAPIGQQAIYGEKSSVLARRRGEWLAEDPPYARPGYYSGSYMPKLFCVDSLDDSVSSAAQVEHVLDKLELSGLVSFQKQNFWKLNPQSLPSEHLPLDLIWVDLPIGVKEMNSLLKGDFWNCLRPDGGLLVIHDMMTTRGGQFLVKELKRQQEVARFGDFELVGLLQPHRLMQGDCILIRKTLGKHVDVVDDMIQFPGRDILEQEALDFLQRPNRA